MASASADQWQEVGCSALTVDELVAMISTWLKVNA
jgi:hypothetical protein